MVEKQPATLKTNEQIEISRILTAAAEYNASDLHLSVGNVPTVRVEGELIPLREEKVVTPDFIEKLSLYFLDENQREILKKEKEIIIAYDFQNRIRFKVNLFYQEGYLSASLRLIPYTIKTLKELGLPRQVEKFAQLKKGLVLICGPFGSGRSTTLAALINEINNTRSEHILTVEKPIEYIFTDNRSIIEQREVGRDTISFTQAIQSATQEDLNVILVSDLKSKEEIRGCFDLAERGSLVFAALDTDSVVRTIERIINSFEKEEQNQARVQLSECLQGIVVQRLITRVGGGRLLVAEVLVTNPAVQSVIREGNIYQLNNILDTSREEGMISLDRHLVELVKTGEISLENALEQAVDKGSLKMMIRR